MESSTLNPVVVTASGDVMLSETWLLTNSILIAIFIAATIIGNSVSMTALIHAGKRSSLDVLLISLNVTCILQGGLRIIELITCIQGTWTFSRDVCIVQLMANPLLHSSVAMHLAALAAFKFFSIVLSQYSLALRELSVSISVSASCFVIPVYLNQIVNHDLFCGRRCDEDQNLNTTKLMFNIKTMECFRETQPKHQLIIYFGWLAIFLLATLVLLTIIGYKVCRGGYYLIVAQAMESDASRADRFRREVSMAKMTTFLTLVFIIQHVCKYVLPILFAHAGEQSNVTKADVVINHLSQIFPLLNWVIYTFDVSVRVAYKDLLACFRNRRVSVEH